MTGGPKTEGGFYDFAMFGNCVERQRPDGTWEHVPIEEWLDTRPPEDQDAKDLAAHIRSVRAGGP